MSLTASHSLLLLALLILLSAFFSLAEIALAASRPVKLRQMADEGNAEALRVIAIQENPGHYFTVVQIGMNALAILGGIVGEGLLSPPFERLLAAWLSAEQAATLAFVASFVLTTSLFIVVTDLIPKQVAMAVPEQLAIRVIGPMRLLTTLLKPLVLVYAWLVGGVIALLKLPSSATTASPPRTSSP